MGARAEQPLSIVTYWQPDVASTAVPQAAQSVSGIFLGLSSQGRQRVMQLGCLDIEELAQDVLLTECNWRLDGDQYEMLRSIAFHNSGGPRRWKETSKKGTDALGGRCWFGCGIGPVRKQVLAAMLADLRRVYEKGLQPINFKRPLVSNSRALWDLVRDYLSLTDDALLEAFGPHVPREVLEAEVAAGFTLCPASRQRHPFPVNKRQGDLLPTSHVLHQTHHASAPPLSDAVQGSSRSDMRSQHRSEYALAEALPGAESSGTQQQVAGPQAAFCPAGSFHSASCPPPEAMGPMHRQPVEQLRQQSAQCHHAAMYRQLAPLPLGLAPAAPASRHSHELGSGQRQEQQCTSLLAALQDDTDNMDGVLVSADDRLPALQHQKQQQLPELLPSGLLWSLQQLREQQPSGEHWSLQQLHDKMPTVPLCSLQQLQDQLPIWSQQQLPAQQSSEAGRNVVLTTFPFAAEIARSPCNSLLPQVRAAALPGQVCPFPPQQLQHREPSSPGAVAPFAVHAMSSSPSCPGELAPLFANKPTCGQVLTVQPRQLIAPAAPSGRHSHELGYGQRQEQQCTSLLAALQDDTDNVDGVLVPADDRLPALQHQEQQQLPELLPSGLLWSLQQLREQLPSGEHWSLQQLHDKLPTVPLCSLQQLQDQLPIWSQQQLPAQQSSEAGRNVALTTFPFAAEIARSPCNSLLPQVRAAAVPGQVCPFPPQQLQHREPSSPGAVAPFAVHAMSSSPSCPGELAPLFANKPTCGQVLTVTVQPRQLIAPAAPSGRHSHELGYGQRQEQQCTSLLAALQDDTDNVDGVLVPADDRLPALQHQEQQQLPELLPSGLLWSLQQLREQLPSGEHWSLQQLHDKLPTVPLCSLQQLQDQLPIWSQQQLPPQQSSEAGRNVVLTTFPFAAEITRSPCNSLLPQVKAAAVPGQVCPFPPQQLQHREPSSPGAVAPFAVHAMSSSPSCPRELAPLFANKPTCGQVLTVLPRQLLAQVHQLQQSPLDQAPSALPAAVGLQSWSNAPGPVFATTPQQRHPTATPAQQPPHPALMTPHAPPTSAVGPQIGALTGLQLSCASRAHRLQQPPNHLQPMVVTTGQHAAPSRPPALAAATPGVPVAGLAHLPAGLATFAAAPTGALQQPPSAAAFACNAVARRQAATSADNISATLGQVMSQGDVIAITCLDADDIQLGYAKLRIDSFLGRGGNGAAFLATLQHLSSRNIHEALESDMQVVIKVPVLLLQKVAINQQPPAETAATAAEYSRARKEYNVMQEVKECPHVVACYAHGRLQHCSKPYIQLPVIVLEHCNLGSWGDLLFPGGCSGRAIIKRDATTVHHVMKGLLAAVCFLTDCYILHSDVKPDNVFFKGTSLGSCGVGAPAASAYNNLDEAFPFEVKLADFGCARFKPGGMARTRNIGTRAFHAPEMGSSETTNYGSLADSYAVGMCFIVGRCGIKCPFSYMGKRFADLTYAEARQAAIERCEQLPSMYGKTFGATEIAFATGSLEADPAERWTPYMMARSAYIELGPSDQDSYLKHYLHKRGQGEQLECAECR